MKQRMGFPNFLTIAACGALLALGAVAMSLGRIAHAEVRSAALQEAQQRQFAQALAWPSQVTSDCPLKVQSGFAYGSCLATYSIPPHSLVLVSASAYAGGPLVTLPMTDTGTPIVSVQSGNIRVSGTVTYAQVWLIAPESLSIIAALVNDTDETQGGIVTVRVLMPVPQTTTPAVAAAGVE
ncbi:MAG: hypothetical protein IJI03_12450 [Rudaea sp.]|nr:hypothetical protein [Rudaea sp.]